MIWWKRKKANGPGAADAPVVVPLGADVTHVYAIGDVHGMKALATRAEAAIAADPSFSPEHAVILYMGDLIDRGPDTAFLLDWLAIRSKTGARRMFLRGNHEAMMQAYLDDPTAHENWLDFGGLETLNSYGILERPDKLRKMRDRDIRALLDTTISQSHRKMLADMVDAVEGEDFFFAHAGVVPDRPLSAQTKADLLWSRDRFMAHEGGFEKTIVHGHTPVETPVYAMGRVSIDTGAYMTGRLTVAKISIQEKTVDFVVVTEARD